MNLNVSYIINDMVDYQTDSILALLDIEGRVKIDTEVYKNKVIILETIL